MRSRIAIAILLLSCVAASPPQLQVYEGRYYVIHTDLSGDDLREAELRMTKLAEEYRNRTKDFSGTIGHKFPFFLYRNPDQAWSVVQFLAHGENGKYQSAFASFMRGIGTGLQWQQAWQANFGSAEGFEVKWKAYWTSLPDDPTADLYAKAIVQTVTGTL